MSILVTASTGNVGSHLVRILEETHPDTTFVALRRPAFDYDNPETYEDAFASIPPPQTVFLCTGVYKAFAPSGQETLVKFFDFAVKKGVKRIVYVSGIVKQPGAVGASKVQEFLESDAVKARGVLGITLRPGTFMGECNHSARGFQS